MFNFVPSEFLPVKTMFVMDRECMADSSEASICMRTSGSKKLASGHILRTDKRMNLN